MSGFRIELFRERRQFGLPCVRVGARLVDPGALDFQGLLTGCEFGETPAVLFRLGADRFLLLPDRLFPGLELDLFGEDRLILLHAACLERLLVMGQPELRFPDVLRLAVEICAPAPEFVFVLGGPLLEFLSLDIECASRLFEDDAIFRQRRLALFDGLRPLRDFSDGRVGDRLQALKVGFLLRNCGLAGREIDLERLDVRFSACEVLGLRRRFVFGLLDVGDALIDRASELEEVLLIRLELLATFLETHRVPNDGGFAAVEILSHRLEAGRERVQPHGLRLQAGILSPDRLLPLPEDRLLRRCAFLARQDGVGSLAHRRGLTLRFRRTPVQGGARLFELPG